MDDELLVFIVLLVALVAFSIARRKLTPGAAAFAALLAIVLFGGTGLAGISLLGAFFVMGVAATSWQSDRKKRYRAEDGEDTTRDARQVLANGGFAAILALVAWILPEYAELILLLVACAMASAAADTVSSELGLLYGRKYYHILTFREDSKGENGVVSIEGTLFGVMASAVVAIVYGAVADWHGLSLLIIVIAGTAGNLADSLLGATLERQNIIGNNAVNFLNTVFAVTVGGICILTAW